MSVSRYKTPSSTGTKVPDCKCGRLLPLQSFLCRFVCLRWPKFPFEMSFNAFSSLMNSAKRFFGTLAWLVMLSPDRIHDIFSRIQKFSSADEVEAIFAGG